MTPRIETDVGVTRPMITSRAVTTAEPAVDGRPSPECPSGYARAVQRRSGRP